MWCSTRLVWRHCPLSIATAVCREELHVVQYKARVATLQEQVRILEEAAKTDNTERSKTLKELATERGTYVGTSSRGTWVGYLL